MKAYLVLYSVALTFAVAHPTHAQNPAEPCCSIKSVDLAKGLATAVDVKTGRMFRFRPADAAQLKALKAGQAVSADSKTGKVTFGRGLSGFIVPDQSAEKAADANFGGVEGNGATSGEPCCNITSIGARTGIVTAREKSTGRLFRFEVKDAELLKSLRVGQAVFADFGTSKVRINGLEPCCSIVGHGPGNL